MGRAVRRWGARRVNGPSCEAGGRGRTNPVADEEHAEEGDEEPEEARVKIGEVEHRLQVGCEPCDAHELGEAHEADHAVEAEREARGRIVAHDVARRGEVAVRVAAEARRGVGQRDEDLGTGRREGWRDER